jgi:hypothetical protein
MDGKKRSAVLGWEYSPPMKVDGQCLCGYIRYEADVDADAVAICHCTDCQILSGSAFRVSVPVEDGSFRFLSGTPKTYRKTASSGARRILAFCPECGTSIYSRPADGESGYFGLRVGALRQRNSLVPRAQYWIRSAQAWVGEIADLPKFNAES